MRERQGIFSNVDGILFLTWLTLAVAGCFTIFSAASQGDWSLFLDLNEKHMRQMIFLVISFILMLVIFSLDYQFIIQSAPLVFIFTIVLLILTLVIGSEINGSKSWIKFGPIQLQPSEFAKTGTALMLAYFIGFKTKVFTETKSTVITFVILAIPMMLILLQGDMGSMLTFTMLIFMFYREGFSPIPIFIGLGAIIVSLAALSFGTLNVTIGILAASILGYLIFRRIRGVWKPITGLAIAGILFSFSVTTLFYNGLKDYQQDRVLIILGLKEDLHGAGYNLWQSKMAVSSGQIFGKGYLQGIQTQGEFVPEVTTDYIFTSIGEEWGFIGSLFVVGMFSILIFRLLFLAERQRTDFSRIFMYCAACFFLIHVYINIGMVVGIFPTAGIPLPFFSSGGSSLISFSIIIALALRFDAERLYILS